MKMNPAEQREKYEEMCWPCIFQYDCHDFNNGDGTINTAQLEECAQMEDERKNMEAPA